ncbi:MAG: heavy metal-associated domain-containing protein [Candidatus Eremiobacterota bacterium]
MHCAGCANTIEKSLRKLPGIMDVSINYAKEEGTFTFDASSTGERDIIEKIKDLGYNVPASKIELTIKGMKCAGCSAGLEKILNNKIPGVISASVNFASGKATVELPEYFPERRQRK